jgi:hypothetical protein
MINSDKIRDYAFVAYLMHNGVKCYKNEDGSFYCVVQYVEMEVHFDKYKTKYKPLLDIIRKLVKNM